MPKIDVMVFEPGKPGEPRTIEDSLEAMQAIVGGYIEMTPFPRKYRLEKTTGRKPRTEGKGLAIICNEDGGLLKLPPNRWALVGTFFVTRLKGSGSGYASLTDDDRKLIEIESADS